VIFGAVRDFLGDKVSAYGIDSICIEKPRSETFGDLCTNAAMVFSAIGNVDSKTLANHILHTLQKQDDVVNAQIAGPGFVNFTLSPQAWQAIINEVLVAGDKYGSTNVANGEYINIEFVSANPTGPLHTGHARNAVLGSVIANMFEKIGYNVIREFYINDKGNQIKSLARSVYLRYKECLGAKVDGPDFSEDMYIGEYVKSIANKLAQRHNTEFLEKNETEWLEVFGDFAVQEMLKNIKDDLRLLGISMDVYSSEKEIYNKNMVDEALVVLRESDDIYDGTMPRPKGMDCEDWEPRVQTLFKSTKYGDDMDRTVRKSDGIWTYFAGDIAYHLDKIQRGYKKLINILGADHCGYVTRIRAAVKALSKGTVDINVVLYQLVNFLENGTPVKMSKRSGNFITLREIVEIVGADVTRFMMISKRHDVAIDFDLVKVTECSMDNPVFYIQYAYARICSVFRNVEKIFQGILLSDLLACDKACLTDRFELRLMKMITSWPEYIVSAAKTLEPHRIPHFLRELAASFHALWTNVRFVDEKNYNMTIARLSLLVAVKIILKDGLDLIGIKPLEEMK
jgi:arginyl-tRNA synthetase